MSNPAHNLWSRTSRWDNSHGARDRNPGITRLKRVWAAAHQAHNRLSTHFWRHGWTIPLATVVLVISLPFWRAVSIDFDRAIMQQIDDEDAALCTRFGLGPDSSGHADCKAALLELRGSHERLMAATPIP